MTPATGKEPPSRSARRDAGAAPPLRSRVSPGGTEMESRRNRRGSGALDVGGGSREVRGNGVNPLCPLSYAEPPLLFSLTLSSLL